MSGNMQEIINLIRSISGQANILTIPRVFIDLTGDLKAALFLWRCVEHAEQSPGGFTRSYQEWQAELGLSRAEIDRCRKQAARWVNAKLTRADSGGTVLRYSVNLLQIATDLDNLSGGERE